MALRARGKEIINSIASISTAKLPLYKKLWENPNPTSAFAAQNVTLLSDDYDFLMVNYIATANGRADSAIIAKNQLGVMTTAYTNGDNYTYATIVSRIVNFTDVDTVLFGDAVEQNTTQARTTNNSRCIPIAIYGFKKDVDIQSVIASVSTEASKCMMSDGVTNVEDAIKSSSPKTDIATVESGSTASRAYAIGELVYVNGNLYKVITTIASGATFTVGTNIQSTTVGATQVKRVEVTVSNVTVSGNSKANLANFSTALPTGSTLVSYIPKSGFDSDLVTYLTGTILLAHNISSSARTVSNGKIDVFYI